MRRIILIAVTLLIALLFIVPTTSATGTEQTVTYADGTVVYFVSPGDTLARIAARFYTTVQQLASLNGIYNINLIYVGQMLYIPSGYVPPPPPPPPPPPVGSYYVVQRGDTLARIAQWFGSTVWAIQQANGIGNPNLIYVGMTLYIPPNTPPPPTYVTPYYVQPGDTLARIARNFGTTLDLIVQYNGIINPNVIYVGQYLNIPHW